MSETKGYVLVAPEGGWGYVVALSLSLIYCVTVVPLYSFGLVFGNFLNEIGEETYGTSLSNGIYSSVFSFTGFAANHLLHRYSCREVGLLGALLFFIGSFTVIYAKDLTQFIISFSILQGFGFGLLIPSTLTAFNFYFDKKKNFVMALCQNTVVALTLVWPTITDNLLKLYGWNGTQMIFAALSLNCIAATLTFQPIKWHLKKTHLSLLEIRGGIEDEAFLEKRIISPSIKQDNTKKGLLLLDSLNLNLFKDLKYVNIAFGMALSYTSDFMFMSMIPMIVMNKGYNSDDATQMMTTYFTFDLISNCFLSILNYFATIRNRYLFLFGTITSAVFRVLFVMDDSFFWMACNVGALGFLRTFILFPLPLVIAETYGEQFTAAYSLYMVVCGVTTLIYGLLIGVVKSITGSDAIVMHTLSMAYILCAVFWAIELVSEKIHKGKRRSTLHEES